MTEQEWRQSTDFLQMLAFLQSKVSDRKLQLFACACCVRLRNVARGKRNREVLQALYDYADARISFSEMREAYDHWYHFDFPFPLSGTWQSALACATCNPANAVMSARDATEEVARASKKPERERQAQVSLLHDLVGNPFRPVILDPLWLTPTVVALAQAVYETQLFPNGTLDPDRLAVLADALEEAGCDSQDMLGHLRGLGFHTRGPGPHFRGCWVLDLLTGRE